MTRRACCWCSSPIHASKRSDARFCSKRCRQASHRFGRGCVAAEAANHPIRWAYADPPYPGLAHLYKGHPDYDGEVDHLELLQQLQGYQGWALSTSADALPMVLTMCADLGIVPRVGAWIRGGRGSRSYHPSSSWEPVIYLGARMIEPNSRRTSRRDSLVHGVSARTTDPDRVIGTKPAAFLWWLFDLLGCRPGDELDDLFPGSGGVMRAWRILQDASSEVLRDA